MSSPFTSLRLQFQYRRSSLIIRMSPAAPVYIKEDVIQDSFTDDIAKDITDMDNV